MCVQMRGRQSGCGSQPPHALAIRAPPAVSGRSVWSQGLAVVSGLARSGDDPEIVFESHCA